MLSTEEPVVFAGRTRSLRLFVVSVRRTQKLIEASTPAIQTSQKSMTDLRAKFDLPEDSTEKEDEDPSHVSVEKLESGDVKLSLGKRAFATIKSVLDHEHAVTEGLQNHLYSIACVALWSSFEGYVQSVLEDVFRADVTLLSSERSLTYADIVDNVHQMIDFLVADEINNVGRKNFSDLNSYLKSRLKVQISNKYKSKMEGAYWIRNVVAHTAGYVRADQESLLPDGVTVQGNQLQISSEYVQGLSECLKEAVSALDSRLQHLYLTKDPGAQAPAEEPEVS